jgi:hypothetical protein
MKSSTLSLLGGAAAAALFALAPMAGANAQSAMMTPVATEHGDWTLGQREEWLHSRLDKARDDGSLDRGEYERVRHELEGIHHEQDRMRDMHDGQLTDNETQDLEARLDSVAAQIHWTHEHEFQRPW